MSIYNFKVKNKEGEVVNLSNYKNKVMLIVNTATNCSFTSQYEGLQKLYFHYHDNGLEILDFPCNQFDRQAPGTDEEIHKFCVNKYGVEFDQFQKIEVNGDNTSPLYKYLKDTIPIDKDDYYRFKKPMDVARKNQKDIQWNFTKFLIDKSGNVVARYSPAYEPEMMEEKIKELIN